MMGPTASEVTCILSQCLVNDFFIGFWLLAFQFGQTAKKSVWLLAFWLAEKMAFKPK